MCLNSIEDLEDLLIYLPSLIKYRKYKDSQQPFTPEMEVQR